MVRGLEEVFGQYDGFPQLLDSVFQVPRRDTLVIANNLDSLAHKHRGRTLVCVALEGFLEDTHNFLWDVGGIEIETLGRVAATHHSLAAAGRPDDKYVGSAVRVRA